MAIKSIDQIPVPSSKPQTEWGREIDFNLLKFSKDIHNFSKDVFDISNINQVSSDYTIGNERVLYVDAASAAVTITLNSWAKSQGQIYWIMKIDSSANAVTIDADGDETINGSANVLLSSQYSKALIIRGFSSGEFYNFV